MKKFIPERIIKTEEELLSEGDRGTLVTKRNKHLAFLLSAYVPLVLILAYVYFSGPSAAYRDKFPNSNHEITEDDTELFNAVVPYTCGFFFLALTGFFIHHYLQIGAPIFRDLRLNKKKLMHIKVEKTEMAFFNRYYITTPIRKKQLVQVNRDDFYKINDDKALVIELAPGSLVILGLTINGERINFF